MCTTPPEQDIKEFEYNGGPIAAHCFLELNYEHDLEILDIGAGTGIIGDILHRHGYTKVDALDGSEQMLRQLETKRCYRSVIHAMVAGDTKLPIADQRYDVVIMAGVFCPGHIEVSALEQILRITKSGGLICWAMGDPKIYAERDEQYRDENFERYIASLCDRCKWISVLGYPKPVANFVNGLPGYFYAMQVI